MSVLHSRRAPRRILLVTAAVAVLAAGGAGAAYASSHDPAPVQTGYVVVDSDGDARGGTTSDAATATEEECERGTTGGRGTPQESSPARPSPSAPVTPDVQGQL
jgi:signal recognition particle GTPase